jgi:hypothetical protein
MDLLETSRILLKSGFLPPHLDSEAKVFAIITMGREIGIGMWQAINGINAIKGKPTIAPQLMLALIYRSGQLEDLQIDADDTRASVTMKRRSMSPHTEIFTMDDAIKLGVVARNDNYKKQPAVMLKWRAVSAACRVVFPDIIMGFYTPEEMGADVMVGDDGDMRLLEPLASMSQAQTSSIGDSLPPKPATPSSPDEEHDNSVPVKLGVASTLLIKDGARRSYALRLDHNRATVALSGFDALRSIGGGWPEFVEAWKQTPAGEYGITPVTVWRTGSGLLFEADDQCGWRSNSDIPF